MKKWKSDMLVENILCFQQTEVVGFVMALMKCTQAKNKKLKLGTGGLTMPEYIERKALKYEMTEAMCGTGYQQWAIDVIDRLPTADVVEVVRCKDCEHWGGVIYGFVCRKFSGIETKICMHADDFCSHGERKEVTNNG
jgi:hypothetical protein